MNWQHRVKLRHLLTEKEDWKSIQDSMNAIADVLSQDRWFDGFASTIKEMRKIPEKYDVRRYTPLRYANDLLDELYDYCDENAIWVEL